MISLELDLVIVSRDAELENMQAYTTTLVPPKIMKTSGQRVCVFSMDPLNTFQVESQGSRLFLKSENQWKC